MKKVQKLLLSLVVSLVFVFAVGTVSAQSVYVCKSKNAKVYHKTKTCSALKKCKASVEAIKMGQAKTQKKRQCKTCYGTAKKGKGKGKGKGADKNNKKTTTKGKSSDKGKGAPASKDKGKGTAKTKTK